MALTEKERRAIRRRLEKKGLRKPRGFEEEEIVPEKRGFSAILGVPQAKRGLKRSQKRFIERGGILGGLGRVAKKAARPRKFKMKKRFI